MTFNPNPVADISSVVPIAIYLFQYGYMAFCLWLAWQFLQVFRRFAGTLEKMEREYELRSAREQRRGANG